MSQRKPTGAAGSPMDDSLATVRVVVTDTRAALIPHTGRRLVASLSDAFVPTQPQARFTSKERHLSDAVLLANREVTKKVRSRKVVSDGALTRPVQPRPNA